MPSLITLQGIDETLANLELKQGTLKAELARVIRSYFVDDHSVQSITSIPTDEIVLKIWGPCQAEELKAKKKNFSSLKSALNKSLKDLDKAGKNQAGIILGRDNVFIVSEERKDDLLKQMGLSPNSPHLLHDMFAAFKKFFSENIKDHNTQEIKDLLAEFEETQKKYANSPALHRRQSPPQKPSRLRNQKRRAPSTSEKKAPATQSKPLNCLMEMSWKSLRRAAKQRFSPRRNSKRSKAMEVTKSNSWKRRWKSSTPTHWRRCSSKKLSRAKEGMRKKRV